MKKIKLLFASFIASFFLMFSSAAALTPANGWMVNISSPANTTSKTFNVQYTTLSVNSTDKITVQLFQNGQPIGSQTTSEANGDSGAFKVTVDDVGEYSYYIKATNTGSPTSKTTSSVSVEVANTPAESNTVNTGSTSNNDSTETASSQQNGSNESSSGSGANGSDSGSDPEADAGNVGDKPASTEDKTDEAVLSQTSGDTNTPAIVFGAIAGLAAIGGVGYVGYRFWITRQQG